MANIGQAGPVSQSPHIRPPTQSKPVLRDACGTIAAHSHVMSFAAAFRELTHHGERITKLEWNDPDLYGRLRDGLLMIHLDDGWHKWIVSEGDLLGTDWVILE